MTTTTLATQADLEDFLGKARGALDVKIAAKALSVATTKVVNYLGYDPSYIAADVVIERLRRGQRRFWLSCPRVKSVDLIEYKTWGTWNTLDAGSYSWDPDGVVEFLWMLSLTETTEVRITHARGWSPIPEDMTNICCELAAVHMASEPGVTQEKIGGLRGYQVTYSDRDGLTEDHRAVLVNYRQPAVA